MPRFFPQIAETYKVLTSNRLFCELGPGWAAGAGQGAVWGAVKVLVVAGSVCFARQPACWWLLVVLVWPCSQGAVLGAGQDAAWCAQGGGMVAVWVQFVRGGCWRCLFGDGVRVSVRVLFVCCCFWVLFKVRFGVPKADAVRALVRVLVQSPMLSGSMFFQNTKRSSSPFGASLIVPIFEILWFDGTGRGPFWGRMPRGAFVEIFSKGEYLAPMAMTSTVEPLGSV